MALRANRSGCLPAATTWGGVLLIAFGVLNGVGGPFIGTCTQGSDDQVLVATVLAGILEIPGAVCILAAGRGRGALIPSVVSLGLLAVQAAFATSFLGKHLASDTSACTFVGAGDFDPTGDELAVALIWLLAPLAAASLVTLRLVWSLRLPAKH